MDISLELKGLPCLNKVYLLTYLLNDKTVTLHFEVHFQKMPEFSQELTNFPLNFGETYQKKKSKEFPMLKEKEHECQRSHVVKKKTH